MLEKIVHVIYILCDLTISPTIISFMDIICDDHCQSLNQEYRTNQIININQLFSRTKKIEIINNIIILCMLLTKINIVILVLCKQVMNKLDE